MGLRGGGFAVRSDPSRGYVNSRVAARPGHDSKSCMRTHHSPNTHSRLMYAEQKQKIRTNSDGVQGHAKAGDGVTVTLLFVGQPGPLAGAPLAPA